MGVISGSVTIVLDADDLADARTLADATLSVFSQVSGHYANTLNSHFRGKAGELAVTRWLTQSGLQLEPVYRDLTRLSQCDVIATSPAMSPAMSRRARLDVKTWDASFWPEMGRCVAVAQLDALHQKAEGIVWCISPSQLVPGCAITIAGWNTLDDVRRAPRRLTGPVGRRQVDNYQLDVVALRCPASLVAALYRPQSLRAS